MCAPATGKVAPLSQSAGGGGAHGLRHGGAAAGAGQGLSSGGGKQDGWERREGAVTSGRPGRVPAGYGSRMSGGHEDRRHEVQEDTRTGGVKYTWAQGQEPRRMQRDH